MHYKSQQLFSSFFPVKTVILQKNCLNLLQGGACSRAYITYTHAHTTNRCVGPCNMVHDSASFSLSNAIFLAKLQFIFSSTCCTDPTGIALMMLLSYL